MAPGNRNYGTVEEGHTSNGADYAESNDEGMPLLPNSKNTPHFASRLRRHMNEDIDSRRGDLVLLLCYVITGFVDSSAVFIWGAFVSMQTGNSIYVGLGLADPSSGTRWIKSLLSIACFCLGSAAFAWFHRFFSPRRRWVLVTSYALQTLLIVAAAIIVMFDKADKGGGNALRWQVMMPLAMMAFGSSGQAVTSRALQYNSLTSVVLTSIYCDLFSDPNLLSWNGNPTRNQRAAAPVALLSGSILGGVWSHSSIGLAGALWTAAVFKGCIVLAWIAWKSAPKVNS
jgi:hypothetical protein